MSGSHLVEQPPEAAAKHPTADPHSEDYAASLRAAALLTLKSKRRRLTVESSDPAHPPRHLVAPPSNQLDYGPEEPSGGVSSIASSPAMRPTASTVPVPDVMDVDDAQAREEGEISDSETPPPSSPVNFNPTPASPKIQPEQMPPPPVPKVEPLSPALPFAAAVTDGTSTSALAPGMYCRPGLRMTEAQYNAARDIILDVLGWGVPPEYLVQIGLSRETIYYIFVDHNLRLPKNMNFKGLPPVVPPPASSAAAANGYSAPTNPPVPSMPSDDSPSALSVSALPFVPGGAANGSSTQATSLHDIEQQRRQELLARKAAQATRKLKQQESVSSTDSQLSTTSAPAVPVPAHTVDDFLKSIDPILPSDVGTSTSTSNVPPASRSSSRSFSVDPMDVDEIPGLTGNFSATTDYTLNPRPAPPRSANPPVATSSSPNVSMPQDRPLNAPSAVGNGNGALPYDDDMESIPGLFQQRRSPSDDSQLANGRRGTKRPVAADFVDMEPGPSRGPSRGIPRRRTTGFSGIQQRRCVIELSDTEEEREDAPPTANGIPMRADSRGFTVGTPQVSIAPTPRVNSPAIPPSATPAALLEKEEQIRQMREKIARAEQVLLRKQVSKTRNALSSTDVQVNGTSAPTQEEDDPSIVQSRLSSRSSSSATPDPSTFPRLNDRADEPPPHVTDGAVISLPNSETTSQAMTPIENCSRFLEHPTTGDKVLTDEAQHEQVVDSPEAITEEPDEMEVDVVSSHPETSAQIADHTPIATVNHDQAEEKPGFQTYRSLLDQHPFLRAHSRHESSSLGFLASSSSATNGTASSTTPAADIDLKPLKQAAVMKYLSDNTRRVCQYELPGGGECRDKSCENIHLSRLFAVEPSDEDTAHYLCSSLPGGQRYGAEVFEKALNLTRLSHPTMPFDARVQEALTRLGLR